MTTPSDVRGLFEAKLKEGIPNPPGEFHPLDLERVKDDKYLNRIICHVDNDAKDSANMLWDILVWRKTIGANDLNENNVNSEFLKEGTFFPHGRDIDGSLLLIFKAKNHVKGQKDMEEIKKVIIYWFDRIEREEQGKKITLFFDMEGCGLGNMDMELIKYLISLLKLYYPFFLNYIIIYQMPWVLSAAFKVVKTLLPAKAVEKMKFASKDTLKEVVPPEQALACWGGKDNYVFEFVPENKSNAEPTAKKVTFAEQGDNQHSPGEMLRLVPNDTITFKTDNEEMSGQFVITNMDEGAISFKIRTTSPEKFRVRPSSGILASGASQTVSIVVQPVYQPRTALKDRFLVLAVQVPKPDLNAKELAEIWQNSTGSKVDEYRLKCTFPEKDLKNGSVVDGRSAEKPDSLANSLNTLQKNCELLRGEVFWLKVYQFITLSVTTLTAVIGYLVYKSRPHYEYSERM